MTRRAVAACSQPVYSRLVASAGLHRLDRDELCSILSLYHLEGLEDFGELPSSAHQQGYWIQVAGRRFLLRFSAKRRFSDMVFEKELIAHLRRTGLPVPRVMENVASGSFTPWSARGRYVCLFEDTGGRRLGLFEVRTRHVRTIGDFLGRMHRAGETFGDDRQEVPVLERLPAQWARLESAMRRPTVARTLGGAYATLESEVSEQLRRRPRGARTLVHGDLFVGSARFREEQLVGVLDFASAGLERATWDLAVATNAWCWEPSVRQMGGPAGAFSVPKTRGIMAAYEDVRPLVDADKRELAADLRLAALMHALGRILDDEITRTRTRRQGVEARPYRDYRHFLARLEVLRRGGAEALLERALAA